MGGGGGGGSEKKRDFVSRDVERAQKRTDREVTAGLCAKNDVREG